MKKALIKEFTFIFVLLLSISTPIKSMYTGLNCPALHHPNLWAHHHYSSYSMPPIMLPNFSSFVRPLQGIVTSFKNISNNSKIWYGLLGLGVVGMCYIYHKQSKEIASLKEQLKNTAPLPCMKISSVGTIRSPSFAKNPLDQEEKQRLEDKIKELENMVSKIEQSLSINPSISTKHFSTANEFPEPSSRNSIKFPQSPVTITFKSEEEKIKSLEASLAESNKKWQQSLECDEEIQNQDIARFLEQEKIISDLSKRIASLQKERLRWLNKIESLTEQVKQEKKNSDLYQTYTYSAYTAFYGLIKKSKAQATTLADTKKENKHLHAKLIEQEKEITDYAETLERLKTKRPQSNSQPSSPSQVRKNVPTPTLRNSDAYQKDTNSFSRKRITPADRSSSMSSLQIKKT